MVYPVMRDMNIVSAERSEPLRTESRVQMRSFKIVAVLMMLVCMQELCPLLCFPSPLLGSFLYDKNENIYMLITSGTNWNRVCISRKTNLVRVC